MAGDIRDFLSKLGDVLTAEEIDEMIKLADIEMNGQIKYEEVGVLLGGMVLRSGF